MSCDQALDVARGARIDGGQREGLHVAGKHDLPRVFLEDRLRQRDRRRGIGIGVAGKFGIGMDAPGDTGDGEEDSYDEHERRPASDEQARDFGRCSFIMSVLV
jgi:hypothetical protein